MGKLRRKKDEFTMLSSLFSSVRVVRAKVRMISRIIVDIKVQYASFAWFVVILRVKFSLKGGVSSLDRKLLILRGFIPRQLCGGKKFALKGGVLHPRIPINCGEAPVGKNPGRRFPFYRELSVNFWSNYAYNVSGCRFWL
jgi:hypothetical protein